MPSFFHLGPWEQEIGFSQSVRVGNRILVSGTVSGDPDAHDTKSQLKAIYRKIQETLAHDGATLKQVIRETIYCVDMPALVACQDDRKEAYAGHCPVSTWVEVKGLYSPVHLLEIDLEAIIE